MESVCTTLGIGRSAAYAAAELIKRRLSWMPNTPQKPCNQASCQVIRTYQFENEILRYQVKHPDAREDGVRIQFDPAYKAIVEDRRSHYGLTIECVSQILKIPLDTLKKFPKFVAAEGAKPEKEYEELPKFVVELANEYLRSGRGAKSVKRFCEKNPDFLGRIGMNYRQCLHWLRRLGFVNPRGIFLKNKGLDKILRFKPNHVWGSDGKRMIVIINGEVFEWVWQCLIDGATTVIVGGIIDRRENTENLLMAIKESSNWLGVAPLAIVLDNRLSEDLPAIRAFLDELNIKIIKIFPGNSKSNGIVEGNFNIFEKWVGGKIEVTGATPEELSRSIAQAFVEVFTQMRNHGPRKSLSFKSAKEVMDEATQATPEEEATIRENLKAMAERFKNEQAQPIVSAEKAVAIAQAAEKTTPPHRDVFDKALQNSRFTPNMILGATAIWEQKRKEHPEKGYGHAYFGGILRHLAEQNTVTQLYSELETVYTHHWDTMGKLREQDLAGSLKSHPEATCTRLAADFMNTPIPAFTIPILRDLKKSFLVASKGSTERATQLREAIAGFVVKSKKVSKERRDNLLCKLFEWENFIRMSAPAPNVWMTSTIGND